MDNYPFTTFMHPTDSFTALTIMIQINFSTILGIKEARGPPLD